MADLLTPTATAALDGVGEIVEVRSQPRRRARPADRVTATVLGLGFLTFAAVTAARTHELDRRTVALSLALVALYGIAYRTEFLAATGSAVPTQPVLVALLFTAPIGLVPALVTVGLLLGGSLRATGRTSVHELLVRVTSGWHCAGPVLVVWLAGIDRPTGDRWPWLALALALQFAVDAAVAFVRCRAVGGRVSTLVGPLRFTFTVDALLAPLAACVVVAAGRSAGLVALVALPVVLVRLLARDRIAQLSTALTLGEALQHERSGARVDPLTGLANRRAWEEAVADAERDRRNGMTVEVLMADVDHLKRVNDTYGHDAGDELLQTFAALLASATPAGAVTARIGGDEFGVLRAGPGHELPTLVPGLQAALAGRRTSCGASVAASFGVAACPPETSVADAVRLADARLVADKQGRRASR